MKAKISKNDFDWHNKPDLTLIKMNINSIDFLTKLLNDNNSNKQDICYNLTLNYCTIYEFMFEQFLLFSLSLGDSEVYYEYFWDQLSRMNTIENYLLAMQKIYHIDSTKEKNNSKIKQLQVLFYMKDILTHPRYLKSEWKDSSIEKKTSDTKWKYIKSVLVENFDTSKLGCMSDLLSSDKINATIYELAKEAMISISDEFFSKFASSYKEDNIIQDIPLPRIK